LLERLKLRSTMSFYFSPRVLERVLQNPGSMEPQAVELTILLTDLRNSTPLAELLGARGTFDLLNKVFEAQTRAVMFEDGTLEHFLGDQFLSYWGAPDPQPDAADRAFRAALALIDAMEKLRETLAQDVHALFGYGVALHRGSALIGNKGSKQRLDYGVVGDLINAAARVESLTKYYGVPFLVTREVVGELIASSESRLIDRVIVKGKSVPLELMELRHKLNGDNFRVVATAYGEAFNLYQGGRFSEAEPRFKSLSAIDQPSQLLAQRCAQFVASPPQDWRGIFTLTTK
jgi:adenylate cyclase